MNKKAQGLSMSTIIIAAIALLVLVILATLLLTALGDVNEGTSCEDGFGGTCVADCSSLENDGQTYISKGQADCEEGSVCCILLG